MIASAAPAVPPAAAQGIITNEILSAAQAAALRLAENSLSDADAALLVLVMAPALQELEQWRRKGALVRDLMSDNVLMFPGARG